MEEKIVYFKNPGKENTADVVRLVLEKAKIRNINKIVQFRKKESPLD